MFELVAAWLHHSGLTHCLETLTEQFVSKLTEQLQDSLLNAV